MTQDLGVELYTECIQTEEKPLNSGSDPQLTVMNS